MNLARNLRIQTNCVYNKTHLYQNQNPKHIVREQVAHSLTRIHMIKNIFTFKKFTYEHKRLNGHFDEYVRTIEIFENNTYEKK